MHDTSRSAHRVRRPLLLTGFGLGAFLDGIVLHQVLQWHHLVVDLRPDDDLSGLRENVLWDGLFHLVSWAVVTGGLLWLVRSRVDLRAVRTSGAIGLALVGWGSFNVVDQVVFHLLLGAHHIRMVEDYQLYDWGYTALGGVIIAVGLVLGRRLEQPPAR